jgi:hypothetical protein
LARHDSTSYTGAVFSTVFELRGADLPFFTHLNPPRNYALYARDNDEKDGRPLSSFHSVLVILAKQTTQSNGNEFDSIFYEDDEFIS